MRNEFLLLTILGMLTLVGNAVSIEVVSIELEVYQNDSVVLNGIFLTEGTKSAPLGPGDYTVKVIDKKGSTLTQENFTLSFMYEYPLKIVDHLPITIRLPYSEESDKVVLLHSKKTIFEYSLTFCNNNSACEKSENYISCPKDCPPGSSDGYCDREQDGKCDPDCATEADIDCACGDGTCGEQENYLSCPSDCPSGSADNYCDGISDGKCDPDCPGDVDSDCIALAATTPTPTTAATTAPAARTTPKATPSPGFEAIFALATLLILSYLIRQRRR